MSSYLFKVKETFNLKWRGVVLAPGEEYRHSVRVGNRVQLHFPDGRVVATEVRGTGMIDPPPILRTGKDLPPDILVAFEGEVPTGTEVYLQDS